MCVHDHTYTHVYVYIYIYIVYTPFSVVFGPLDDLKFKKLTKGKAKATQTYIIRIRAVNQGLGDLSTNLE